MSNLYIRVMTGFYTHRKTVKLKIKLGTDAYWIPPRLWAYAAENQPDGNLSAYSSEELAELLGCPSYAKVMLQALKDSGFVDESGIIHDWDSHNGYHERFAERAKTAAAARWAKVAAQKAAKEKSPTPPKEDKEDSGNRTVETSIATSNACSITAEDIYKAYPLKVGKPAALKSIAKAMQKLEASALLDLTKAYAARRNGEVAFTPHPSTWFNQERYNDDPSTWERSETNGKLKPDYDKGF